MQWAQSAAEIGNILSTARRHRGLTQAQLARETGVTQAWISQVEQGKDNAQLGKVLRLLSYLGVRLRVGEAPWDEIVKPKDLPKSPSNSIPLSRVLDSLSGQPAGRRGKSGRK